MTTLHITIRRNSDGEVRTCHWSDWHPWTNNDEIADEYWWSEGNFGCDCNRHLEFERANGHNPHQDPDYESQCGEDKYTVLSITQDDDPTVLYSEEDTDD